jgi:outer membrane receptor for monomeric catechols
MDRQMLARRNSAEGAFSAADISQSTDTVDNKELAEQNLSLMQDALRNVPGITLNSGEGGAHGDSVNLRGLSIPDSFFLDGVRDIGQYQRDAAISVSGGQADYWRGTGDFNLPLSATAAARVTLMDRTLIGIANYRF